MDRDLFPESFLWGAATSAFQIEGSPLADGAGPSNWYRFTHTPGLTVSGDTGDVACDHYRRYASDVDLMARLGLGAYRFSLAWSRILPEGRGAVNSAGLDFYARLVDRLLERGITPFATLYHWDHPAALDDRGGWLNPDSAAWFAEYARVVVGALGDRVAYWTTLNEPWVVVDAGFLHGVHAPGHRSLFEAPRAAHNLLRAHGAAVQALRAGGARRVGLVVNLAPKSPASPSRDDREAAERDALYMNRQYLDPALLGRYPEGLAELYGEGWPAPPAADLRAVAEPLDFIGVNYYTRTTVRRDDSVPVTRAAEVRLPRSRITATGWEIYPDGLAQTLRWVTERYGRIPIFVTENGACLSDPPPDARGRVADPVRVDYLRTHIAAVRAAMNTGVDVRGYFVWSLMDNLEWASGYAKRFGLYHVDFSTQKRTPKDSARFYREVIRTRGRAALGNLKAGEAA
jgi:beta-glucosidase